MKKSILLMLALGLSTVALGDELNPNGGQIGSPIGLPDLRPAVERLSRVLPSSYAGDYVGVTPRNRWCAITVAANGWEFYASTKLAVPGAIWSFGRPSLTSVAASIGLTTQFNPVRVTSMKEDAKSLFVAYRQIIPHGGVNLQLVTEGSIRILKNEHGRPSRVEIVYREVDRWNGFFSERSVSCGEPIHSAE